MIVSLVITLPCTLCSYIVCLVITISMYNMFNYVIKWKQINLKLVLEKTLLIKQRSKLCYNYPFLTSISWPKCNKPWLFNFIFHTIQSSYRNASVALKAARRVEVQTADAHTFADKLKVVFVARFIEKIHQLTTKDVSIKFYRWYKANLLHVVPLIYLK